MSLHIAFYKGRARLFNRVVSWWERGPYSHCELVVGASEDGALCWSSSFLDGGVRLKTIKLDPDHWDLVSFPVSAEREAFALEWFRAHEGQPYDVRGLLGFVWRPCGDDKDRWYCNEAIGASLQLDAPWRFAPNGFASILQFVLRKGLT